MTNKMGLVDEDLVTTTTFDPEDEYRPEPEPEPLPPAWLEGGLRIGIHTSIAGSHVNALESAAKLGCTALQIFSVNPRMWAGGAIAARITEAEAKAFRDRRAVLGLGPLVIHANYLINLAAPAPMLRTRSIQSFHEELVRGIALGADFVVVHPGSYTDSRPEFAVGMVIDSVKQAVKRLPANSMRILIENTAGMGSAVGSRIEEVGEIVAGLSAIGAGACLDTAHLFAAGYDIRTASGLESTIEMIDQTIRLANVPVIHANDSKIALGGRVDRHEHIGKGKIGAEAFRRILTHPRFGAAYPEGVPGRAFIAETPIDDPGDDRKDVAELWELAGLSEKAPAAEKGYSMLTAAAKKKAAELAKKAKKKKTK